MEPKTKTGILGLLNIQRQYFEPRRIVIIDKTSRLSVGKNGGRNILAQRKALEITHPEIICILLFCYSKFYF